MNIQKNIAAILAVTALLVASGCAVSRGQESMGAYIDDASITTSVKAHFVESKAVDASSITVETLNGVVVLSGFAKSAAEKSAAESVAMKVSGVKSVKNDLAVKP